MAIDLQSELRHLDQADRTLEQIAECIALIKRGASQQAKLGVDNSSTLRVLATLTRSEVIINSVRDSILDRLHSTMATRITAGSPLPGPRKS